MNIEVEKSNMDILRESVRQLSAEELERALDKWGDIHSEHEGYALIKEEVNEAFDEYFKVESELKAFWRNVMKDKRYSIDEMYSHAVDLACEAIQVGAMAKKVEQYRLKMEMM